MSRPATDRLKVNPPVGTKPALRWLRLGEVGVDYAYQRSLAAEASQSLIRKIAQFWDWSLCQPLTVAKRPNGALMIVDGQHRHAAAKLRRDIEALPCVVNSYPTAGDEAAAFVALNQQRRPLTALDLFRAAIAAGDTEALAILEAMKGAGLQLAKHSNYTAWKPGDVSNIGGIQRAYRVYGRARCNEALKVFGLAWPDQVLRYCGTLWPGIARVVAEHDDCYDRDIFVGVLRQKPQREWASEATAKAAETGHRRPLCVYVVMRDALLSALGRIEHSESNVVPMPAAPEPTLLIGQGETKWCDQCDERRTHEEAAGCRSRFCSLKRRA